MQTGPASLPHPCFPIPAGPSPRQTDCFYKLWQDMTETVQFWWNENILVSCTTRVWGEFTEVPLAAPPPPQRFPHLPGSEGGGAGQQDPLLHNGIFNKPASRQARTGLVWNNLYCCQWLFTGLLGERTSNGWIFIKATVVTRLTAQIPEGSWSFCHNEVEGIWVLDRERS